MSLTTTPDSGTTIHRRTVTADQVSAACTRFTSWLDREGYASHDPYDIWGTPYGLWSRRIYYRSRLLGTPLVAPLVAVDIICPSIRRLLLQKQRYATADAQLVLAFLNLAQTAGDRSYVLRAQALGQEILGYAIPGYRGPCWGYAFDWQNGKGAAWLRNTPYITCTPYCYEAFLGLYDATRDEQWFKTARGIAEFVCHDLRETPTSPTAAAGSYSPHDSSKVVNASAYRAYVLIDAGARFGRPDSTEAGRRNLAFVLQAQRPDGAWLYTMDHANSFIDNFHTCFNLKNLYKLNVRLGDEEVRASVNRGYDYYLRNLFHPDGDPKSFAVEPRLQLARLEMYNFAEGITLGSLLANEHPGASSVARSLAARLICDFQLPEGHFVTRVFRGGIRHTVPFLRWPQAQLFYALTNLFRSMQPELSLPAAGTL